MISEACIAVKDRACVDVCPIQCIYEYNPATNTLFSEEDAGSGVIKTSHAANPDMTGVFGDRVLYVSVDECTSCTVCYQPEICPVGAIYSEEQVLDGATKTHYNSSDPQQGTRPHVLHPAESRRLCRLAP